MRFLCLCVVIIIIMFSCNNNNKSYTGNIGSVMAFDLNLRCEIIESFTDSLMKENYWVADSNLDIFNYDHINYRVFNFEESYKMALMVKMSFPISILYVYSYEKQKWLNGEHEFSNAELGNIRNVFVKQVLERIKSEAISENMSNEDIYHSYNRCGTNIFCNGRVNL